MTSLGELDATFDRFVQMLRDRLAQGSVDYGDRSLNLPPPALLDEIEEELVDVCGWSVVLLHRVRRMRGLLAERLPWTAGWITRQTGVFTPLALTPAQVDALRADHAIYLPRSGWINVAALPEDRVPSLRTAIDAVRT